MIISLHGIINKITNAVNLVTGLFAAYNGEAVDSTLDTGLYAVWNADSNSNDSIGTNHGTLMGSTSITAGKLGNAFNFSSATSDYVQLPSMALKLTGDFSISLWIYRTSSEATIKPILRDYPFQAGSGQRGWEFFLNSAHQIAFRRQYNSSAAGSGDGTNATVIVPLNTWTHIGMTWNATTRQVNFIQDGDVVRTITLAQYDIYYPNPDSLNVSRITNGNFNGKIDGLTVWNRLLTGSEITALGNGGNGVQYPFNGQTLTSKNDSVGTNHGILWNGATFSTGLIGRAFSFDGVNDYISLNNNSLNLTGDFTISLWVYATSGASQSLLSNLGYQTNVTYKGWQLGINQISGTQTSKVTFVIGRGPASSAYTGWAFNNNTLTLNSWNHIVITRVSGVNTYCWINNIAQTNYTLGGSGAIVTTDPVYHTTQYVTLGAGKDLGGNVGSYIAANSKIDALTIWNRTLTETERTALYNSGNGIQLP